MADYYVDTDGVSRPQYDWDVSQQARDNAAKRAAVRLAAENASSAEAAAANAASRTSILQKLTGVAQDARVGIGSGTNLMRRAIPNVARGLSGLEAGSGLIQGGMEVAHGQRVSADSVDKTFQGTAGVINPVVGLFGNVLTAGRDALLKKGIDWYYGFSDKQKDFEDRMTRMGYDPATGKKIGAPTQTTATPTANQNTRMELPSAEVSAHAAPPVQPSEPDAAAIRKKAMQALMGDYRPGQQADWDNQLAQSLGNEAISDADAQKIIRQRRKPTADNYFYGDANNAPTAYAIRPGQGLFTIDGKQGATSFGGLEVAGGHASEGGDLAGLRANPQWAATENAAKEHHQTEQKRLAVGRILMGRESPTDYKALDMADVTGATTNQKTRAEASLDQAKAGGENARANSLRVIADLYRQQDAIQNQLDAIDQLPEEQKAGYTQQHAQLTNQLQRLAKQAVMLETGKPLPRDRSASDFEIREVGGGVAEDGITPIPKRLVRVSKSTGMAQEITPTLSPMSAFGEIRRLKAVLTSLSDKDDPDGSYRAQLQQQIRQFSGGGTAKPQTPPVPGARLARDGKWYVQQGKGYAVVE